MTQPYAATQTQIEQYNLARMREGPYYEAKSGTLRIPHRYKIKQVAAQWQERKMAYDAKRFEYWIKIPEKFSFAQVYKARQFYFGLYKVYDARVTPLR